jgi:hypothetical protein
MTIKQQRRQHRCGIGNVQGLGGDLVVHEDGKQKRGKPTKISKHRQGYKKRGKK